MLLTKDKYISYYMAFLCFVSFVNGVVFWRDEQMISAAVGIIASALLLLALIAYRKGFHSFLRSGMIILSTYTLYMIGSFIWTITSGTVTLFLVILVILLKTMNVFVIFKLKEAVNLHQQTKSAS